MRVVRRHWRITASAFVAAASLAYWWVAMSPSWDPNLSEGDYHAWDERTGWLPLLAFFVGVAIPVGWAVAWLFNRSFPPRSGARKSRRPRGWSGPAA